MRWAFGVWRQLVIGMRNTAKSHCAGAIQKRRLQLHSSRFLQGSRDLAYSLIHSQTFLQLV